MGRPRTSGDKFSFDDLAVVAKLTKSAIQNVAAARLLPRDDDDVCDIRTLKRVAVIGAFVASGVPLMAAAKIAEAAHLEFGQADGEVPSGLDNHWRELPKDELSTLPDPDNDYWLHDLNRRHPNLYKPGRTMDTDAIYEIAEREYVFLRKLRQTIPLADPFAPGGFSKSGISPVGRIEGWRRGGKPRFVHLGEDVKFFDLGQPTDEAQALYDKMLAARENAVGLISVNLSLAIRKGLDRLADHREIAK